MAIAFRWLNKGEMFKPKLLRNMSDGTAVYLTIGSLIAVCIGIVSMLISFIGFWTFMYALLCGTCVFFLIAIMLCLQADLDRKEARDSKLDK